jgi:hypothetical protein
MPSMKLGVTICLLAGSLSSWAGYLVDSHVEVAPGTNRYTWTVYNEDQSWGLDGFAIEVPVQTRVLAHTVPPPYANPNRTAYWHMEERHEQQVDAHDGRVNVPAPRPGMKLLLWWGVESPSVYPPGTTVAFSVTTDSSVGPGVVKASAATYSPQNSPHWYACWYGRTLGPSMGVADASPARATGSGSRTIVPDLRSVLATNLESNAINQKASIFTPLPAVSIAIHAGITVEGVVGLQYGIQYNTDLADTSGWRGLANVILTAPKQVWYDPEPALNPQRYYRVVPGLISVP